MIITDDFLKGRNARHIPGAFYEAGAWHLELEGLTPRAASIALTLFPEMGLHYPELRHLRDDANRDVRPADHATPFGADISVHAERVCGVLEAKGWSLHPYQAVDLGYLLSVLESNGGAYVAWSMGLGKTLATCALIDAWQANYNLIVCPNSAKASVWGAELHEYTPWVDTVILRNSAKHRQQDCERVLELMDADKPVNFVVHYEAVPLVAGKTKVKQVSGSRKWEPVDLHYKAEEWEKTKIKIGDGWQQFGTWDLIVCDEGHRLRNANAQMTKAIKKIPRVGALLLSGTPIMNNLEELWSQLQFLYPKIYSSRWATFNDRFLDYAKSEYGQICLGPRADRLDAFRDEVGRFMVVRRADDELDIPEAHERTIEVPLTKEQRRAYDELVSELRTTLADGTVLDVDAGLPLLSKLRQVATGLDLVGSVADSSKLEVLEELVGDNPDETWLIFGWYKATLEALADRLGRENVHIIHGDKTRKQREEAISEYRSGKGRIMLATIASLSEAVNLQVASQVVFLDRGWTPAENAQARGRAVRQGQTKHVGVTHIVAADTVDAMLVNPTLDSKAALIKQVLGG